MDNDLFLEETAMADALDVEILMHRDAHFGGSFSAMLEYYQKGGPGVQEHFSLARIQELFTLEVKGGSPLAPLLLSGSEAEQIARAKKAYRKLKSAYQDPKTTPLSNAIADLILSEEESPEKEMAAVAAYGSKAVDPLIQVLKAQDLFDPLFPGYGKAPWLAAEVLGRIGDKKALFTLFELLGSEDLSEDDIVLGALAKIGEPAKQMALKVAASKPLNYDNDKAALVLLAFVHDLEVREHALKLLEDPEVQKRDTLADYLILLGEGLKTENERQRFVDLAKKGGFSEALKKDMQTIIRLWDSDS